MESEESYLVAIKEVARALVETAMKNAHETLKAEIGVHNKETDHNYVTQDIQWIPCNEFSVDLGMKQIEKYISTWELHDSWLHCTDFLKEEDLEFSKLFHYRVKWSIPTRRKPIPRATVCVYFTIQISKIKPDTLPVQVFFMIESTRLVHRPGQTRFREKWLKDVIESKIIMMNSITF
ncbi:A-kinase anchor protein 14 [Pelodytes ibericus]